MLIKPVTKAQWTRLERYAEHEWHRDLNEKRAKQEKITQQLAELRAKGHIINLFA